MTSDGSSIRKWSAYTASLILLAGCGSTSTVDRGASPQGWGASQAIREPQFRSAPPSKTIYVSMDYAAAIPTTDPLYGEIDGYSLISPPFAETAHPVLKSTPGPSQILNVPCNTDIVFVNFDSKSPHTASTLTPYGNGFPLFFNNPNGTIPSRPMTPISFGDPNYVFSSGDVAEGGMMPGFSYVYNTGRIPGPFFIGDYLNYDSTPSMRTVAIVTGC